MDTNRVWPRYRKALLLATLLFSSLSPAWSNVNMPSPSSPDGKKVCYCGCDMKSGTPACTKMCELPKYQNRWWAKNCQTKPAAKVQTPAATAPSHASKKNNRVQAASL